MVSFESSNYHGVEALTKGKRYVLAMWFTLDPEKREVTYEFEATNSLSPHNSQKIVKDEKSGQERKLLQPEEPKDEL